MSSTNLEARKRNKPQAEPLPAGYTPPHISLQDGSGTTGEIQEDKQNDDGNGNTVDLTAYTGPGTPAPPAGNEIETDDGAGDGRNREDGLRGRGPRNKGGTPDNKGGAQDKKERAKKKFRKVATKLSKKIVNIKYELWSNILGPRLQTAFIVVAALSTGASVGYFPDSVDPNTALQQPPAALVPEGLFDVPQPGEGIQFGNESPATTPTPPPPTAPPVIPENRQPTTTPTTEPTTTTMLPTPTPSARPEAHPLQSSGLWAYHEHVVDRDDILEGVAISADGNRIATGGRDQLATIILDSRNADNNEKIMLVNKDYLAVALNHDGSIMAASGKEEDDAVLYLLSEDTDPPFKQPKELQGHTGWVKSVSLSADGSVLASGSESGEIMLWDTTASESTQLLRSNLTDAHRGHAVQSVALSADGTRMVSGGADSVVRLWNIHQNFTVEPAHEYKVTEQHSGVVHAVAISADGTRVASGSADGDARVWDFDTGDLVGVFADAGQRNDEKEDVILGVSLNSDGSLLATGSKNGFIRLWNTFDDSIPALHTIDQYINGTNGNVTNLTYVAAVSLNANGTLLAAACKPAVVYFWDVTGVVELLSSPLTSTMRQHHNHRKLLL